jgi:ABC-2 type transport system ATP-binding protein
MNHDLVTHHGLDRPTDGLAVRLAGLAKRYGDVPAVRGVDLDIAAGEVVALLGPNGAGKSTTIDMLLGLTRPDRGIVQIFGDAPGRAVAAGAVGAMLQSGTLLPDATVAELVSMFAALHRRPLTVPEALGNAGIADLARRRVDRLSGGQTQRLRFALAIVPDPDLLVLDEPTVGMDVQMRRDFWAGMRRLTGSGRTVLFATHYLEEADAYADRAILMRAGEVIADGSPADVKQGVAGRTITATVAGADPRLLAALPGVSTVESRGPHAVLHCHDSDTALRHLLSSYPEASDIEVAAVNLEDAFLAITNAPVGRRS